MIAPTLFLYASFLLCFVFWAQNNFSWLREHWHPGLVLPESRVPAVASCALCRALPSQLGRGCMPGPLTCQPTSLLLAMVTLDPRREGGMPVASFGFFCIFGVFFRFFQIQGVALNHISTDSRRKMPLVWVLPCVPAVKHAHSHELLFIVQL